MSANISVVIPTADRAEFLLLSVESILNQRSLPFEIVIVDNGRESIGLCDSKINEIKAKGVGLNVIKTKPRIGVSAARNIGAQSASGQYIAFLDDDDLWDENYIHYIQDTIEDLSPKIIVGKLNKLKLNGKIVDYKCFPDHVQLSRQLYYKNPGIGGQNLVIEKSLFLHLGGFDEAMVASEDRDLGVRIIREGEKIHVQKQAISYLREHEEERARDKIVKGTLQFLKKHYKYMTLSEIIKSSLVIIRRYFKHVTSI